MADCLPQEQVALDWQTQASLARPQQVVGLTIVIERVVWLVVVIDWGLGNGLEVTIVRLVEDKFEK